MLLESRECTHRQEAGTELAISSKLDMADLNVPDEPLPQARHPQTMSVMRKLAAGSALRSLPTGPLRLHSVVGYH